MRFTKSLLNDIPIEKSEIVFKKMKDFEEKLLQVKSFLDMPKGFWVRRVVGTDIYKFRVNSGDRVLFKYENTEGKDSILFIAYRNHDQQIRTAKNYKGNSSIIELDVVTDDYEEDGLDIKIDEYIREEVYNKLEQIRQELVIEDEYIALSVEENDINNMYFLSLEQYECLKTNHRPNIVFGCAGSGKTMIGIRQMIFNNELMLRTMYLTCSNMVLNRAKEIYGCFSNDDAYVDFSTLKNICLQLCGVNEDKVIGYQEFYKWILNNNIFKEADLLISIREVWVEINTIIKGRIDDGSEDLLKKEQYFACKHSTYEKNTKKIIYNVACMYTYWLKNNGYYDENDLARIALNKITDDYKYDYIIYDEIQELTNVQLLFLVSLVKNTNNTMLLGDLNQAINISRFNVEYIKNIMYKDSKIEQKFIAKNYRNGSEIVNWINQFKRIKNNKFRSNGLVFSIDEEPIKKGDKPCLTHEFENEKIFFEQIDGDIDSIVIVAEEIDKIGLLDKGYPLGRIFTIEEVRGLEYSKVYCYNILSKFEHIWESILTDEHKSQDVYSIYFNLIYIAITRATKRLWFIEKHSTKLDNNFVGYWEIVNDDERILREINYNLSREKWLEEAIKLEEMEKFYQAYEAYKKAGKPYDAKICLKAHERQLNYNNTEQYSSYVQIIADLIDTSVIEKTLTTVKQMYNLSIMGYIEVEVDFEENLGRKTVEKYISPSMSDFEVAGEIYEVLCLPYISRERIVIKTCFYRENKSTDTTMMGERSFIDLSVISVNGNILVEQAYFPQFRILNEVAEAIKGEYEDLIGNSFQNEARRLRNRDKYKSKSAEDILKFIFDEE